MKKRTSKTVHIGFDLPIEVAEFIAENGDDLVSAIKIALNDFRRNPPPDQKEAQRQERKRKREERNQYLVSIGRQGFRLLRQYQHLESYVSASGFNRIRGGKNGASWQDQIIRDIADELGIGFELLKLAISRFRKKLKKKATNRRNKYIVQYAFEGLSNEEIAQKYGLHKNTVSGIIQKEIRKKARGKK